MALAQGSSLRTTLLVLPLTTSQPSLVFFLLFWSLLLSFESLAVSLDPPSPSDDFDEDLCLLRRRGQIQLNDDASSRFSCSRGCADRSDGTTSSSKSSEGDGGSKIPQRPKESKDSKESKEEDKPRLRRRKEEQERVVRRLLPWPRSPCAGRPNPITASSHPSAVTLPPEPILHCSL